MYEWGKEYGVQRETVCKKCEQKGNDHMAYPVYCPFKCLCYRDRQGTAYDWVLFSVSGNLLGSVLLRLTGFKDQGNGDKAV